MMGNNQTEENRFVKENTIPCKGFTTLLTFKGMYHEMVIVFTFFIKGIPTSSTQVFLTLMFT